MLTRILDQWDSLIQLSAERDTWQNRWDTALHCFQQALDELPAEEGRRLRELLEKSLPMGSTVLNLLSNVTTPPEKVTQPLLDIAVSDSTSLIIEESPILETETNNFETSPVEISVVQADAIHAQDTCEAIGENDTHADEPLTSPDLLLADVFGQQRKVASFAEVDTDVVEKELEKVLLSTSPAVTQEIEAATDPLNGDSAHESELETEAPSAEPSATEASVVEASIAEDKVATTETVEETLTGLSAVEASIERQPPAEVALLEQPAAKEPVADEPVVEEPVADETVADETVADETVADETVADETVADEPVAESALDEAAIEDSVPKQSTLTEQNSHQSAAEDAVANDTVAADDLAEDDLAEEANVTVADAGLVEPVADESTAIEPVAEPCISKESEIAQTDHQSQELDEAIAKDAVAEVATVAVAEEPENKSVEETSAAESEAELYAEMMAAMEAEAAEKSKTSTTSVEIEFEATVKIESDTDPATPANQVDQQPPAASQAVASEPVASEPVASEPVASEPVASEPVASEPELSQPVALEPVASETVAEPIDKVTQTQRPNEETPTQETIVAETNTDTGEPGTAAALVPEPDSAEAPATQEPNTQAPVKTGGASVVLTPEDEPSAEEVIAQELAELRVWAIEAIGDGIPENELFKQLRTVRKAALSQDLVSMLKDDPTFGRENELIVVVKP